MCVGEDDEDDADAECKTSSCLSLLAVGTAVEVGVRDGDDGCVTSSSDGNWKGSRSSVCFAAEDAILCVPR